LGREFCEIFITNIHTFGLLTKCSVSVLCYKERTLQWPRYIDDIFCKYWRI